MQNIEKKKEYSSSNVKECLHCKTEFSGRGDFCCLGCSTAHKMISGLGLDNFYSYLEEQISRNSLNLQNNYKIEEVDMTEFVIKDNDGNFTLNLMVEGLHCSSCVWLIEEALKKQSDILHARLNMSTRRLVIRWKGQKKHGSDYTNLIRKMGYRVTAFDPETLKNEDSREQKNLLLAMAVAGFASGNIMLISAALWSESQEIMGVATRDFLHLISALIATPAVLYSGRIFFKSAWVAIKNKRSNMDLPISIAIILTLLVSIFEWVTSSEHTYFDSAAMLVFFLLIGRYLDVKSKNKARSAATNMLRMINNSAILVGNSGRLKTIPISKIKAGDIVQVNLGEKIPVDGEIIKGNTEIDTSIITGESMPKIVSIGEKVFAATINLGETIRIKVIKPSKQSLISEVIKLMEKAEDNKTKYNSISDKFLKAYGNLIYFAGALAFAFWYFYLGVELKQSMIIAVSVLIITCPCAFGLAIPAVQVIASGKLFKNGIILKNGNALEALSRITHIVFDKTGTLTLGKPKLINKHDIKDKYFKIAASMAAKSKHPYSKAIMAEYHDELLDLKVKEIMGVGLETKHGSSSYKLQKSDNGLSFKEGSKELAIFKFEDEIRSDAKEVISELKILGISSQILSGDNKIEVENVANAIDINNYNHSVMPDDKAKEIEILKKSDENVLMVGDGLNDAPALAFADVSISPSTAIDITQNSADIVFQGEKLSPILACVKLANKSISIIKQNFAIAFIYNIIAIPVAFAGYTTPLIAATAMSFSSTLVVLNSLRVR